MDLYRPHAYFTPEEKTTFSPEPDYGDGVFPDYAKGWGANDFRLSRLPFIASVLIAGLAVALAVAVLQPQDVSTGPSPISNVAPVESEEPMGR